MVKTLYLSTLILSCTALLWAVPAVASDPCATCANEPSFPEASAFLTAHGYPAAEYTVLLTWSEQARDGSDKYVTGYHMRAVLGGKPFDLYSDGVNSLLTDAQVAQLGIAAKQWDLPPAEVAAQVPESVTKAGGERPTPVGPANGLNPANRVVLPLVDLPKILQEDASQATSGAKGKTRIGVFQNLDPPITVSGAYASHGVWQAAPNGGKLWSVAVSSPEALGMRVHFASIALPAGAQIIVYNENNPIEAVGPYTGPAKDMTDLWGGTTFSESIVVECFVPQGANLADVHVVIDKVTHQYVPYSDLAWAKAAWTKAAGSCNNDVTCFPAYATTATGIALYNGTDSGGQFACSGTLLADSTNTGTPFFLTANHCVGSSSTASSMEFFWLYQTATCNGTPPDISTVPTTTGGASLLATTTVTTGTDFCLVRMNHNPPSGIAFVGWSSAAMGVGTQTACIHHPSADFKRISFGSITNVSPDEPANRFYQNTWTSGVTEPGSSGSPLLTVSGQQVIGQLFGGPSACDATPANKLDYFGRFDQTFPLVRQYLSPTQGGGGSGSWLGAKTLQTSVTEALMPPTTPSDVNALSPLAVRVTASAPIDAQSVTIQAQGDAAIAGTSAWRPTDPTDGSDGWAIFTAAKPLPIGAVTLTVTAKTVSGTPVGPTVGAFQNGAPRPLGDVTAPEVVEDATVAPLPSILASGQSPVYRIYPAVVFGSPFTVRVPISGQSSADSLDVYYYSESLQHTGWYVGGKVLGWIVPNSKRAVTVSGQNYLEFQVNYAGVFQLGKTITVQLGSAPLVDVGATGSRSQWLIASGILFVLVVPVVRRKLRRS